MANGVTIPIKGDISNLNSEIEKAKKLIGTTQSELYENEKKLYDVKEKRVKQDERYNNVMSNYKRLLKEEIIDKDTYSSKIKQLNEIKKELNRANIVEERGIRNVIALNKQRIKTQETLIAVEKTSNATQNISNQTIDKKEKSLSNLANTTIRYLRWAGTIAGVVYAGQRAWQSTMGVGIEVNKIVETNTYGIAALVSANTEMIDSLGNSVTPLQKFTMGQDVAKKALAELRIESVKTAATFPQLIAIYQQALPHALSVSNNAFGNTVDEISKNTIKFASRLSVLGESIGMEQQKILEESRSLFSANASTDSLMSTLLFGSPSAANEAIKKAKEVPGGLKKLFEEKLAPFDVLLNTKTYSRSVLEIQASWQNLMGDMMEKSGAFQDITDMFYSMSKTMTQESDGIIKKFDAIYNSMGTVLTIAKDIGIAFAAFKILKAFPNPFTLWVAGGIAAMGVFDLLNEQVIKMQHGGKTQEEWNAEVKKTNDEYVTIDATLTRINKSLEETSKRKQGLEKALNIYGNLGQDTSSIQKELQKVNQELEGYKNASNSLNDFNNAEKNLKVVTQTAELIKTSGADEKLHAEAVEEIAKGKGKIFELEEKSKKYVQEIQNRQKTINEQQALYDKGTEKSTQTVERIALLKKQQNDIAEANKAIETQIAEEKEKTAKKQISDNNTLAKQSHTLNQQYAEQASVQAEIAMIESGIFNDEKLKVQLSLLKINSLTEEYSKLQGIEDKEKARLEILREGLRYEELISAQKTKQLQDELSYQNRLLELQPKGFSKELQSAGIDYAQKVVAIEGGSGSVAEKEKLIELETELYNKTIERMNLDRNVQFTDTLKNFQEEALERQIALNESMYEFGDSFEGSAKKISAVSKAFVNMNTISLKGKKEEAKLDEKYAETFLEYADDEIKTRELLAQYTKDTKELTHQKQQAEIAGYANIAGAMSSMFAEGSRDAAAFQAVQSALALTQAITGITAQSMGDPYTAIPRMIAMAAMMRSLLSNIGVSLGMGGTKTTSDAFSAQKENTGTGTVLGDTEAQSESITKSLELLKDYKKPEFQTLQSMDNYLENISNNMAGFTSLLIRQGGFAFGEGANEFDTGYKNNLFTSKGAIALNPINDLIAKIPIIGQVNAMFGSIINSVVGGLFGKKSVSQALTDSGIYFADTLLTSAIKEFNGQSFQTIATTVKKKSWFGSSESTSIRTYFEALDSETNRQFSLVLDNLYQTTILAGDALDTSSESIENSLNSFVVKVGKISLKGKTGDQIQEQIEAIFGQIGDDIAKTAFPLLTPFQKIGEGMFETLTRVSTGMEVAEYYIGRLGKSFEDLSYTDILNKQGDVGFEALLQSIVKTDEAVNGLDNNLVKIVESLDGTAEELYGAYTALDQLRDTLKFLNLETETLSFASIRGAGSLESLSSGLASYTENFLTESQQLSLSTTLLQKEFSKLNISMPVGKEGFISLINSIDKTTEAGQELFGSLIILSDSFAEVADGVADSIATLEEALKEESQGMFDKFISSISKMFDSIVSMAQNTEQTILGIKTSDTGNTQETIYNQFVEYNKLLAKFESAQLSGDISTAESAYSSILGMSSSLASAGYQTEIVNLLEDKLENFDLSKNILRVNIVDGLGSLLNLTKEQSSQLQSSVQDGVVTNQELANIKNLTQAQKDGILEFANNSNYFSTEDTLQNLSDLTRLQLEALKKSQAEESEGLSKKTFNVGDYIGKQEQIDISKTLGVSYETAKPLISQIQSLSSSKNLQSDINNMLEYTGTAYNTSIASQLSSLSPYLSNDIKSAISNTKNTASANLLAQQEAEKERLAKANFLNSYNQAVANYTLQVSEKDSSAKSLYDYINSETNRMEGSSIPENFTAGIPYQIWGNWRKKNDAEYQKVVATRKAVYNKEFTEAYSAYNQLIALEKEKKLKGYATGGYTGNIPKNAIAGFVHGQEYVLDSNATSKINSVGSVTDMVSQYTSNNGMVKELVKIKDAIVSQANYFNGIIYELKQQVQILTDSKDIQNECLVTLEAIEEIS